jgi:hypothetical protein
MTDRMQLVSLADFTHGADYHYRLHIEGDSNLLESTTESREKDEGASIDLSSCRHQNHFRELFLGLFQAFGSDV